MVGMSLAIARQQWPPPPPTAACRLPARLAQLCRQLQARGWRVYALCRRSSPDLDALSTPAPGATNHAPLPGAPGSLTVVEGIDVASDACVALVQAAVGGAPVGLVIANAGILGVDCLERLDVPAIRAQVRRKGRLGPTAAGAAGAAAANVHATA